MGRRPPPRGRPRDHVASGRLSQVSHAFASAPREVIGRRLRRSESQGRDTNPARYEDVRWELPHISTTNGTPSPTAPASVLIRQFIRRKYACRSCQEHVAIPPKPLQPIDKGVPGPGLLAHVITNKYSYHLPLYRQEDLLAQYGVTISPPRRTRDGPEQFLAGFSGYLQADAFAGYDRLCAGANVIRVACWAHARRKLYDARNTAPLPAHEALARIRQLYRIEDASKDLSTEEHCVIRQREAVPLLSSFGEWLDEQHRKPLPKSPIGQAISYSRAQWQDLQTYTCDGDLSIDNNVSERSLRAQAIGRKNYMFVGSDRGGRTAATLYSLVGSCRRHHIDPFAYLKDVLERLPSHSAVRLGELLPDVWIAAHTDARRKAVS
jgi:Transposase IS66 family/IS66 C-terminal element